MSDIGWRFQILVPSQQFFYRVGPTWLKIVSFLGFLGGSPVNFGGISTNMGSPRTVEWLPPCTSYWGLGGCGFGRNGWNPLLGKDGPKKRICFKAIGFAPHSQLIFLRGICFQEMPRDHSNIVVWGGGPENYYKTHALGFFLYSANFD